MKPKPRYQPGDKIGGRYQVHKVLMGGMGEVYLCLDLKEKYPYVLKTFQQRYQSQALRHAFEQEIATWVALEKHANIVRCFRMDTLDYQPFMFLEWIAGEEGKGADLRSWLLRGSLKAKQTLEIGIDICRGLAYAQQKQPGLVHRDLKPENILIAQGGLAKVTDFGLAQTVAKAKLDTITSEEEDKGDGARSLVQSDGVVGTPAYMPPEQWRGESLDARTDIYAVGCILYEMLTGQTLFHVGLSPRTREQVSQWLSQMRVLHERGSRPAMFEELPTAFRSLVQQCLSRDPADRPDSLETILDNLTQLYWQEVGQAPPERPKPGVFTAEDYDDRGNTYNALGLYNQALTDYEQALQLDPQNPVAYSNRGLAYKNLGKYEAALATFNRAIDIDPDYAPFYLNRGANFIDLKQEEAALRDFDKAIKLDPKLTHAYTNRANIYRDLNQLNLAIADYNKAIELRPNPVAYFNRGMAYRDLKQYEVALTDFSSAIELDPNFFSAYTARANTYRNLGQLDPALADYNKAIQLHPDPIAYFNRGRVLWKLKQREAALADFNRFIELDPNDPEAYGHRARIYQELNQDEAALADFNRVIELDPNSANNYFSRGLTYFSLGDYRMALADISHTIELDPEEKLAYLLKGKLYRTLNQPEMALVDYNHAIEIDPNYLSAYIDRGITFHKLQQLEKALADFNHAIELNSKSSEAYYCRALLFTDLHQIEMALADYNIAIEHNPNYAQAYVNAGAILANQGELQEALAYFEKAAQLGADVGVRNAARVRQLLGL